MLKQFKWIVFFTVALLFVGALVHAPVGLGQTPGKDQEKKVQQPPDPAKILQHQLSMANFQVPNLSFKEFLGIIHLLMDVRGTPLEIVIDFKAFAMERPAIDKATINDTEIKMPAQPATLTLAKALEHALAQIPTKNATYVVMPDRVLITTIAESKPKIDRKK